MLLFPRSFKVFLKQSYISLSLASLSIIVYIAMMSQGMLNQSIYESFNAFHAPSIINGEYFRLIGWLFVHDNFLQLFFTILALLIIGSNLEKLMGPLRFGLFYFSSGIVAGLVIVYLHTLSLSYNSILFGAAPSIAGSISGLLFIQLRRPRWFDNTDVRLMWVFVAVYLIVIFGGLVLNLSPSVSLVIYMGGLGSGAALSFLIMPKDRFDN